MTTLKNPYLEKCLKNLSPGDLQYKNAKRSFFLDRRKAVL